MAPIRTGQFKFPEYRSIITISFTKYLESIPRLRYGLGSWGAIAAQVEENGDIASEPIRGISDPNEVVRLQIDDYANRDHRPACALGRRL